METHEKISVFFDIFKKYVLHDIARNLIVFYNIAKRRYPMAIQIKQIVGKNFEKIRKKLGLAQDELAYETKTSQHTVSHIENGAENFKIDTLDTYLKYFGIPPFYLFYPKTNSNQPKYIIMRFL